MGPDDDPMAVLEIPTPRWTTYDAVRNNLLLLENDRLRLIPALLLLLCLAETALAQDLEPRRWSQIPTGLNFAGFGYGYIEGDIFFDPVLLVEEAKVDMHNVGVFYMRSLSVMGKSARVDFTLPYRAGRWDGIVNNAPVNFRRRGLGDARMRFSMLLYGGTALTPREFAQAEKSNTVVGAAVAVSVPTGEYSGEQLINLGNNRWVIRPQLGVTHTRGKLTGELTGSVFFYTDNNDFWRDTELENDPLYAVQAHLIYTFRPGLWASISTAYGWDGEATVNDIAKNNLSGNWLSALSVGLPINRKQGVKITLLRGRTQTSTGIDVNSLIMSWSVMF